MARTAGFRMLPWDAFVLAAGAIGTVALWPVIGPMAGLIAMAVGHFFLFCNVFRVRRNYELAWSATFLANVAFWTYARDFSWPGLLATQLPLTAVVIALELRSPDYHGIRASRVNPRLAQYLAGGNLERFENETRSRGER